MSRTQMIFAGIIGLTLLVVCGAVAASLLVGGDETTATTTTETDFTVPENVSGDAVLVTIASSNTKQDWMNAAVEKFNSGGYTTADGRPIAASVSHVTSGGSKDAILAGDLQPVAWSPGDPSWVDQANEEWKAQNQTTLGLTSQACQSTVYAPLGFAMWRPMAEALGWPETPIGWNTLVELAADPEGWANPKYDVKDGLGHPEWGQFRFGHTHPQFANSGLLSMTGFVHGVVGTNGEQLSAAQVYEAEDAMRALEQVTSKYGRSSPNMLELMTTQGPSFLHAVAVPEADVVKFNLERQAELDLIMDGRGFAFIFPSGGTIWADHPYCVLDNAEWVDEAEAEAGQIFFDFLMEEEQQSLAMDSYLRPLNTAIVRREPLTLENGTDPTVSPDTITPLPSPTEEVATAVIDLFLITKRKATVIVVLDTSGSMRGERISTATSATVEFLERLNADDEVTVMQFSDSAVQLAPPSRAGDVKETLAPRIRNLIADGNTALYDAVCQATALVSDLQEEDLANGESRLYGIVLLSDGEDTVGRPTENQMFATCLPSNAEADGVKIFPIAFGEEADEAVLFRVAQVTGGALFTADTQSISSVYVAISAEQ